MLRWKGILEQKINVAFLRGIAYMEILKIMPFLSLIIPVAFNKRITVSRVELGPFFCEVGIVTIFKSDCSGIETPIKNKPNGSCVFRSGRHYHNWNNHIYGRTSSIKPLDRPIKK